MSLTDLEVLIFKVYKGDDLSDESKKDIMEFITTNGYLYAFVESDVEWTYQRLNYTYKVLDMTVIPDDMTTKAKKKVLILQARGFNKESLDIIAEKINAALMEYDMEVLLLDQRVKLEKADTFLSRIAKMLNIYDEVRKDKKKGFKLTVDKGEPKRKKKTTKKSKK